LADGCGFIGGLTERFPESGRSIEPVALRYDLADTEIFPNIPA
jgi:hypothetical protein